MAKTKVSTSSGRNMPDLSGLSFDDLVKGVLTVKKSDIDEHFKKDEKTKIGFKSDKKATKK